VVDGPTADSTPIPINCSRSNKCTIRFHEPAICITKSCAAITPIHERLSKRTRPLRAEINATYMDMGTLRQHRDSGAARKPKDKGESEGGWTNDGRNSRTHVAWSASATDGVDQWTAVLNGFRSTAFRATWPLRVVRFSRKRCSRMRVKRISGSRRCPNSASFRLLRWNSLDLEILVTSNASAAPIFSNGRRCTISRGRVDQPDSRIPRRLIVASKVAAPGRELRGGANSETCVALGVRRIACAGYNGRLATKPIAPIRPLTTNCARWTPKSPFDRNRR